MSGHVFNGVILEKPGWVGLTCLGNISLTCILSCCGLSRGSRTPYWGLEQSPSWMPASSRKGKSSGGEGPAGPWHRGGHRARSASQTSRPEEKAAGLVCNAAHTETLQDDIFILKVEGKSKARVRCAKSPRATSWLFAQLKESVVLTIPSNVNSLIQVSNRLQDLIS